MRISAIKNLYAGKKNAAGMHQDLGELDRTYACSLQVASGLTLSLRTLHPVLSSHATVKTYVEFERAAIFWRKTRQQQETFPGETPELGENYLAQTCHLASEESA